MSSPIHLRDCASLALGPATPIKQPLGQPVAASRLHAEQGEQALLSGVWECTPGRWRRQVLEREFSHFIAGHCIFTPDGGEPIEIRAGDAVLFPANCQGEWDIHETVRKSFVIIP